MEWNAFAAEHRVGDVVQGQVSKSVPFGVFVEIDGVTGLLVHDTAPKPGDTILVKIDEIDTERRRVRLSAV